MVSPQGHLPAHRWHQMRYRGERYQRREEVGCGSYRKAESGDEITGYRRVVRTTTALASWIVEG